MSGMSGSHRTWTASSLHRFTAKVDVEFPLAAVTIVNSFFEHEPSSRLALTESPQRTRWFRRSTCRQPRAGCPLSFVKHCGAARAGSGLGRDGDRAAEQQCKIEYVGERDRAAAASSSASRNLKPSSQRLVIGLLNIHTRCDDHIGRGSQLSNEVLYGGCGL